MSSNPPGAPPPPARGSDRARVTAASERSSNAAANAEPMSPGVPRTGHSTVGRLPSDATAAHDERSASRPPVVSQRFSKQARVLRRAEFLRAQSQGRRVHSAHFTVLLFDRGDDEPARLGLTTARKVGKAVVRNRARRVLREVFRLHRERFPSGHDCIVIVRDSAPLFALSDVTHELLSALLRPRASSGRKERPSSSDHRSVKKRSDETEPPAPTGAAPRHDAQQPSLRPRRVDAPALETPSTPARERPRRS